MKTLLTYFGLLLLSGYAIADGNDHDHDHVLGDWHVFGFATQAVVVADGATLGGSSNGRPSFSKNEIVVSANKRYDYFDFRSTFGIRDEDGLDENKPYVRYLLIDKSYNFDTEKTVGARIGKVPHSLGIYNKDRNNYRDGMFIYLPDGIYREQYKWLAMSGWGGQVYSNVSYDDCDLYIQATVTRPELVTPGEIVAGSLGRPYMGEYDKNKSIVKAFNVELSNSDWLIHYDYTNLDFVFDSAMEPYISSGDVNMKIQTLSGKYNVTDKFSTSAEYIYVSQKGTPVDSVNFLANKPAGGIEGYVLSFGYQATEKLKIGGFYSTFVLPHDDDKLNRMIIQPKELYVRSLSIAGNYIINKSWNVRTQYTKGKGTNAFVSSLNTNSDEKWNYFALQGVYSF